MAELSSVSAASVYNQVYHIQKPDYSREVAEESNKAFVLVLLTSSQETNVQSRIMIEIWRDLARKFGDVKFCQMRADLCIDGYPDRNTPTILIYHKGDIARQIVTLGEINGLQTKTKGKDQDMSWISLIAARLRAGLGESRRRERWRFAAVQGGGWLGVRGQDRQLKGFEKAVIRR
jgi:hypothetical protein